MPARKIPKNFWSLTGFFYSYKNGRSINYESALERDFFLFQEFLDEVFSYEEQPLFIEYQTNGKKKKYPPDCLVTHTQESNKRPVLVEVKYTYELTGKKKEVLEKKFKIAKQYADDNDMDFKVVTEKDIRGLYLENLKFIYTFSKPPRSLSKYEQTITDNIAQMGEVTVKDLLGRLSDDRYKQAEIIPSIWHLIVKKVIIIDLSRKISNTSLLRVNNG